MKPKKDAQSQKRRTQTPKLKAPMEESLDKMIQGNGVQKVIQVASQSSTPTGDEVVGFETERSSVIDRLERGSKTLQVVAIVGMPGLGKTTLATKVYNDSSIRYHFHVRARCSISQVFDQRKVLLELLKHTRAGENSTENEDDLAQELRCSLLGCKYLIFIDDVWDLQAYNCLKESFPDNYNGSRILLTSRQGDLVPEAIFLPQLTVEESLELLQRKLFLGGKDWPPALQRFGMEVAEYCKGLPLTIVIVAGILTATTQNVWKEVLESLRSGIISTLTDECVNSIELSYKHLPRHLKPCFLSFGAFPEDHVISVKRLIWQWMAEGFVQTSESKRLEEVALDYLNILIDRCLVMKARENSRGGVKALHIHDLLHDFCSRKAVEELSAQVLKNEPLPSDKVCNLQRLCIHSKAQKFKESNLFCPRLHALLFFHPMVYGEWLDMSFICHAYKLLRVLAMDEVDLTNFPSEIGLLVHLQYLAIQVGKVVCPSIGNLTNLQTLILYTKERGPVKLCDTFWNLKKLRHLYLGTEFESISLPVNNFDSSCSLVELESFCTLTCYNAKTVEKQLRKFPSIRRLKCKMFYSPGDVISFSFLSQLESLSLYSTHIYSTEYIFPENIKELHLDLRGSPWDKISTCAELPNLEVLKLVCCEFTRNTWHVNEGEFPKLKSLKLKYLDIVKWTAASHDQFSNLEKLVLEGCRWLEEIPECLENVATLKLIDVSECLYCVEDLVKRVECCQRDMGNSELQVHVRLSFKGFSADWYYAQEQAIGAA